MQLYGANSPLKKSNKELRMKQWYLYFRRFFSSIFSPQDYAIKADISLALLSFIFGGPRKGFKKEVSADWQETDNVEHTGRGW